MYQSCVHPLNRFLILMFSWIDSLCWISILQSGRSDKAEIQLIFILYLTLEKNEEKISEIFTKIGFSLAQTFCKRNIQE